MRGQWFRLKRWWSNKMHELEHRMGNNSGSLTTWWERDENGLHDRLMLGFKCDVCGKVSGAHESFITQQLRGKKGRYRDI